MRRSQPEGIHQPHSLRLALSDRWQVSYLPAALHPSTPTLLQRARGRTLAGDSDRRAVLQPGLTAKMPSRRLTGAGVHLH